LQSAQKRLEELSEKETISPDELFEKAGLIAERQGNEAALPLVRQLLEMQPEHAEANYIFGGMLLEKDDESGFEYLDKAMRLDPRWKLAASEIAFNYLRLKGRHEEAKPFIETIESQQEIVQKAEKERSAIHQTDSFEPHQLAAETLELMTKKISYHDEISSAYLVCKTVQFFPEIPLHVLFLTLKSNLPKGSGAVSAQDVVDTIGKQAGELGIQYIYAFGKNEEQYKNKIATIEKSKIYGE
jgi:tetratricopeptide (TPR) repeat protein